MGNVILAVFVIGALLAIYAWKAPRRRRELAPVLHGPPSQASTAWTSGAGEEFAGLSETERCEMVFAVAAFDDQRSHDVLEHALNDPAEPVATAAAHALASTGRRDVVARFLSAHPGERADRISALLALLDA